MMTENLPATLFVACCKPLPAQHATNAENCATVPATSAQPPSLKALALLALGRNNPRNTDATAPEKPRNNTPVAGTSLLREKLAELADAEEADPGLIRRLPDADVAECAGLPTETLRAYVCALRDDDMRQRGKVPADETARALCAHCGPVWVHPAVAAVAPVVDSWPRVFGCAWFHVKGYVPRPLVTCDECKNYIRDAVNPEGGMGRCTADREPLQTESLPYPHAQRQCEQFKPEGSA